MSFCLSMLIALMLDRLIGWPDWLYKSLSHPVVWIGKIISYADSTLNQPEKTNETRKMMGVITSASLLLICGLIAYGIAWILPDNVWGMLITALLAWPFLASKSLYDHVMAVARPLSDGNMPDARHAVSMIVGRDPNDMDSAAISRAAIESLAENTSDGITAPLFWGALLGLPGLAIYKAINTADSMIGYKNAKYMDFGWASAKIDDVANFIPARLTGICYAALATDRKRAFAIMQKDAPQHRSPNAGWPEAALAASLNVRLSGPRQYEGTLTEDPWLNAEGKDATPRDIVIGLSRYDAVLLVCAGILLAGALILG